MQQVSKACDPAPSRWSYRFQRLMLTPFFRLLLRVGVPFCFAFGLVTAYFGNEERQEQIVLAIADMRHQIETRPEFMVELLAIEGASESVEEDIREIFPFDFPSSSFDIDIEHVHQMITGLPAVRGADVRIRKGGTMVVTVVERIPVAVWRTWDEVTLVDAEGFAVAELNARSDRADLPVIAGPGANADVPGAMALLEAAAPLGARVIGLVRMGERRWDLVLDQDQRILLPEEGAVRALERVLVLNQTQDMLARDLTIVDMRLAGRPTVRLNQPAAETWWRVRRDLTGGMKATITGNAE
ncbi:MAG: cell division protein FtsQ/DivIB [Pseudomonadota bacterium]